MQVTSLNDKSLIACYLEGNERAFEELLNRHSDVDFLYYNTDINAAGGLLYCLEKGMDIPGQIGLAGFNSFEVLTGLPMRIATMDSQRLEIGRRAANLIAANELTRDIIKLQPEFLPGDTVRT